MDVEVTFGTKPDITSLAGETSIAALYPATVNAGDYLAMLVFIRSASSSSSRPTAPGWDLSDATFSVATSTGVNQARIVAAEMNVAAGTEGGTTVTVTRGGTTTLRAVAIVRFETGVDFTSFDSYEWRTDTTSSGADPSQLDLTFSSYSAPYPTGEPCMTWSCFFDIVSGTSPVPPALTITDPAAETRNVLETKVYGNPNNSNEAQESILFMELEAYPDDTAGSTVIASSAVFDETTVDGSHNQAAVRMVLLNAAPFVDPPNADPDFYRNYERQYARARALPYRLDTGILKGL